MNDFDRFQAIQRLFVTAGFSSKLDVRREHDYAVIKLTVSLGDPDPAVTQTLVDITTANHASSRSTRRGRDHAARPGDGRLVVPDSAGFARSDGACRTLSVWNPRV